MDLGEKFAIISDIKEHIELCYSQADFGTDGIVELGDVTPIILEAIDLLDEIQSDYAINVQKKYKKGGD